MGIILRAFTPLDPDETKETWPPSLTHFSASSANMFMRCPEQWRRVYLLGERRRPSSAAIWGRSDHFTISTDFGEKLKTGEHLSRDVLGDVFNSKFSQEIEYEGGLGEVDFRDAKTIPQKQLLAAKTRDAGIHLVYLYQQNIGQYIVPLDIEEKFTIELNKAPVPIMGYIDLVATDSEDIENFGALGFDKSMRIIERKTTSQRMKEPRYDWYLQSDIYQLATGYNTEWQVSVRNLEPRKQSLVVNNPAFYRHFNSKQREITEQKLIMICGSIAYLWSTFGPDNAWPDAIAHPWACNYCSFGPKDDSSCYWWTN